VSHRPASDLVDCVIAGARGAAIIGRAEHVSQVPQGADRKDPEETSPRNLESEEPIQAA